MARQINISQMKLSNNGVVVGRVSAGTGVAEELTSAPLTAMLDLATPSLKGLMPATGTASGKFLRDDLTWATVSGGGGPTDGDKGDITIGGSGTTYTIDNNAVTFAKMQTINTASFLGRITAATGNVENLTGSQATTLLDDAVAGGISGRMTGADKTKLNGIAAGATVNSSDATLLARANHTGTQSIATILAAATARIFGRITASGGAGEELTGSQVTTLLDDAVAGGIAGRMTGADKTKLNGIAAGATVNSSDATLLARANHTGTQSVSTILAAATSRFFGRITASGGAGEEMTGTQATSLLDVFTTTLKGLVPAPSALAKKYLRDDGTWQNDVRTITYVIDGGGVVITTGVKGYLEIPFGCTIVGWTLLGDVSTSSVVDVWKDTYANYPPVVGDVITASAKPTLTAAVKNQSSTLTGWTVAVAAGDILAFNVNSNNNAKLLTLSLKVTVD